MEKDYKKKYARQRKYDKKTYNIKHLTLYIRKDDPEVLEKLESVPSKNSYIIGLIRKDIENEKDK